MGSALSGLVGGFFAVVFGLTQTLTNGLAGDVYSPLSGTLQAPVLGLSLGNSQPGTFPWGPRTAAGTNAYTSAPNTGVIRAYDFTITRGTLAPDGYQKPVLMINGAFPGPTIEANWGDTIQVTVHNQIVGPAEGTGLHWHGILQKKSQWSDGVLGVSQCPIAPGDSYTYSFTADLYGTSWYHSHYSAQYADGLIGPMIIHGPTDNVNYDIDLGPILLSDWYHKDYVSIVKRLMSNGTDFAFVIPSDNNFINGKNNFDCSTVAAGDKTTCTNQAGISQFRFTTGKTHRLRLINAGSEGLQRFSIDGHTMTVMANDFVPIVPYSTKVVTLGIGQRTDVLVTANAASNGAFYMRSNISTICSVTNQGNAVAAIYYDYADTTKLPTSTPWNIPDPGTCSNDDLSLTVPSFQLTPTTTPTATKVMDITFGFNATKHFVWSLDGTSFRTNYNAPVLLMANTGSTSSSMPAVWNVKDFGSNSSIRVIINNKTPVAHPMHLHGHNMFLLSEGAGNLSPADVTALAVTNPLNPQRRDVQLIRPYGHIVWQIDADNPGVWPFHCHIAWHVSGGLYANILERPADVANLNIPSALAQMCRNWATYTGQAVVDQIDSGL